MKVLYFLVPMAKETYTIFIRNPGQQGLQWDIFRKPFSDKLWFFLFGMAASLAILMW